MLTVLRVLRSTQSGMMEAASALEHSNAWTDQLVMKVTLLVTAFARTTAKCAVWVVACVIRRLPTPASSARTHSLCIQASIWRTWSLVLLLAPV